MLISVQELARDWDIQANGVIHVGAHLGEEATQYENENWVPVIWVEAQPNLVAALRTRLKPPLHCVIEAAVWNVNNLRLDLNLASNSQSSSLLEFGSHSSDYPSITFTGKILVDTKRLDSILESEEVPNFINLDIQGVEMQAIESLGELLLKIDYIFVEINRKDVYVGCTKVWELDHFLLGQGFRRRVTRWNLKQGWGDALYVRRDKDKRRGLQQYIHSSYNQAYFYFKQFGGLAKRRVNDYFK
jgi:FkbM family methyltransferase